MAATRRVTKEYADLQNDPVEGVKVAPEDESNILKWTGIMEGPAGTPYENGTFGLTIDFPREYPFKTPVIKFVRDSAFLQDRADLERSQTTRMYHMNIMEDGSICIGLLKAENWKPSTKIDQILRSLRQLLVEPNPDDALVASIADLYRSDKGKHDEQARLATSQYAR